MTRVENAFRKRRYIWKTQFNTALNEGTEPFTLLQNGFSVSEAIKKINVRVQTARPGKRWYVYEGPLLMPGYRVPLTVITPERDN